MFSDVFDLDNVTLSSAEKASRCCCKNRERTLIRNSKCDSESDPADFIKSKKIRCLKIYYVPTTFEYLQSAI